MEECRKQYGSPPLTVSLHEARMGVIVQKPNNYSSQCCNEGGVNQKGGRRAETHYFKLGGI